MTLPWIEGEPHPIFPTIVKGEIPGSWINTADPPPPQTPEEMKVSLEPIVMGMGGSDFIRDWIYKIYGIKG